MKYLEAQAELKRILNDQQTVSVPKLRRLINSLNVSLNPKEPGGETAVHVLKTQVSQRENTIKQLKQKRNRKGRKR